MSITDNERTEIFSRLGQLEGARVNEAAHIKGGGGIRTPSSNGGGAKAFASVLVIISIIGGMAAIVRPMQQQTNFIADKVAGLQIHASDGHPARIEAEVNRIINRLHIHDAEVSLENEKVNILEQKVAVLTQQMIDGTKDRYYSKDAKREKEIFEQKIKTLEVEINHLKENINNVLIHTIDQ